MSARLLREITSESDTFDKERSSGVRAKAVRVADDEAPTLRPLAMVRTASEELAPIHELLYRFDVGDHRGALAAAEALLDGSLVPAIVVPHELLTSMPLDSSSALLLSCIDSSSTLEVVLEKSGLPMLDALRAICDLVDARVVVLRA